MIQSLQEEFLANEDEYVCLAAALIYKLLVRQDKERPTMATSVAIPNSIFYLSDRNRHAGEIIKNYTIGHAVTDIGIGLAGTLFPGGGIAAMVTSMVVQAPLFYHPMLRKLAAVYLATPDELTDSMAFNTTLIGVGADLAAEIGSEFFTEILWELLHEGGISVAAGFIPLIGGIVSAGVDATLAATLTWRIGKMASIYYQNGGWIHGRKETYERAKVMTPWSPVQKNDLSEIPNRNPEVKERQAGWVLSMIKMLKELSPNADESQLRTILKSKGLPDAAIDEALRQL